MCIVVSSSLRSSCIAGSSLCGSMKQGVLPRITFADLAMHFEGNALYTTVCCIGENVFSATAGICTTDLLALELKKGTNNGDTCMTLSVEVGFQTCYHSMGRTLDP